MNSPRRGVRLAVVIALAFAAVPIGSAVIPRGVAVGAESDVLRVAGTLPDPIGKPKHPQRPSSVVAVDAARRRLYLTYTDTELTVRLLTYDLTPRIPRQIDSGVLGPEGDFTLATRYTVALDTKRQQLAFVTPVFEADGHAVPSGTATVAVYSMAQRKVTAKWNLASKLPGYYPMGITYAAKDDRYYAIGEFSAQRNLADGTLPKVVGPGTAVVAVEASNGGIASVRSIPECPQVLYSKDVGSLIARSKEKEAVYFACVTGGTASAWTYPGEAGLVRLGVGSNDDSAKAAEQEMEFFPVSGNYFAGGQATGIAAFDETVDRFYLQSISFSTPGAFVFDGRMTAWAGFVAARTNTNYFIGVNEGLGHLYIGLRGSGESAKSTNGILVANVRQTPVPAGDMVVGLVSSGLMSADRLSNRLFVRPFDPNGAHLVVEDLTPKTSESRDNDYDAETTNTKDTPAADVFYSLGATGYGAQSVQVGGRWAPGTALGPDAPDDPSIGGLPTIARGTRALMTARVGVLALDAGGASASAQAALPDVNTIKEYESNGPDRDGDGKPDAWPYPSGTCLDAGGRPVKSEWRERGSGTAGYHYVDCNLAKNVVKATARMGAAGEGGMTISKSAYQSVATRDRTVGGTVISTASADGISYDLPGGYVVKLGGVTASTTSRAHGTPGTSYAVWTRDVEGIRVLDPLGKVVLTTPACSSKVEIEAGKQLANSDTCNAVAGSINRLLQTRFKIDFPIPFVAATPRGAFGGIEQTKAQYFQQVVMNDQGVIYRGDNVGIRPAPAVLIEAYNDTTERSRTVTALAATQANAIFQVNPPFNPGDGGGNDDGGTDDGTAGGTNGGTGGGGLVPGGPGTPGAPGTPGNLGPQTAGPGDTQAIPVADLRGFLFLRRGLKDTALLLLLAGLTLGGAGTMWRRRRLVEVLVTVPRKEAAL